ncbi:glycosyltransferase family 2 protein [Methylotenera sp. N17]|uniref:glycosyltransferase family 2 protein n=1 Tax=Methylotenera sp. N17 TaxID=1502761 RepID=UPI00068F7F48|nr:glycosyltransferase family 2 protein [Methylotenera sp. N17]
MNNLSPAESQAIVSIGMFVYNGEDCIRDAIDSILNQTFKNFELIISDNASTDNTETICREYANADHRIRYIRQSKNIGASANSLFVLDNALGEYYMWAAHDDIKSPDFLEYNLKFLQENPDFVASTSPVRFKGGLPDPLKMSDKTLDQNNAEERFLACLNTWRANGRFYSLYRRYFLVDSQNIRRQTYLASDIAFTLEMTIKGKFNRIENGYVELGRDGVSGSGNIYRAYRTGLLNWFLPLHEFSAEIWRLSAPFSLKNKVLIAYLMIKINFITFLHQIKTEIKLWVTGRRAKFLL